MLNLTKIAGALSLSAMICLAGCSKEAGSELPEGHSMNDGHDHSHDGHDHDHEGHDHSHEKAEVPPPSPELKKVVLIEGAPTDFSGVSQAKAVVENGVETTVEGRVKDFVAGKAAFTIVDGSLKACNDTEGDNCPTPWDYCCVNPTVLTKNTATVKLVDTDGNLLSGNLQGVNSIDHLTTVVVSGKVEKDAQGNITIAAANVYLKK